jgi:hypothetical protein
MIAELERLRPLGGDIATLNPGIYGEWLTARANCQGEAAQLFVFGTNSAWAQHLAVAAALPPSIGSEIKFERTDAQKFRTTYQALLAMMCSEAFADPRPGCDR